MDDDALSDRVVGGLSRRVFIRIIMVLRASAKNTLSQEFSEFAGIHQT
ncbi:MAG: hypothetical protein K9N10_02840 [Deltaproteobacteria bacterium]|nr:hypothetical protein [Deltaproteobacteria bacterium]